VEGGDKDGRLAGYPVLKDIGQPGQDLIRLERVGRTLGASPPYVFFSLSLPLAARGILRGCALTWARAISEFGSLMVLAYRPFTAPTLIYNRFSERGITESAPIAVLLVFVCVWAFVAVRFLKLGRAR
jgi:molybdate/tungstate transport system permease protein